MAKEYKMKLYVLAANRNEFDYWVNQIQIGDKENIVRIHANYNSIRSLVGINWNESMLFVLNGFYEHGNLRDIEWIKDFLNKIKDWRKKNG